MEKKCHPLLKGGRRETKYSHGFSSSDLEVISSIAETFFPSLPTAEFVDDQTPIPAVQSFYQTSASQYPIPDEVIFFPSNLLIHPRIFLGFKFKFVNGEI